MESFMREFEHLKIRLQEIQSATKNFNKTKVIGRGGFGKVYGGELPHSKGNRMAAIKRLDRKHRQGGPEFWEEITILARHTHENLITLLGFCIEHKEMILVYEYACNRSLDHHLNSTGFTWTQRLKTCLGAARGLSYLHDTKGSKEIIIHRDIKSGNILLDAHMNAKVSDMGLSKIAPANQQHRGVFTNAVGTPGYCDPLYRDMDFLTKESDVYSFGVVLFEVLCGRLCFEKSNGQVLVPMWKENYKNFKLQEIIFDGLKQQMHPRSLKIYSDIAYKCLQESPEERPLMLGVVEQLEVALQYQELHERLKLPEDYKEMLMITEKDPLNNIPEIDLKMLLFKGTLLNWGKTWFSLNMDGKHCEMVSIAECLTSTANEPTYFIRSSEYNSRFKAGCYEPLGTEFKTYVRAQFLSPQIRYTVNLVFKLKKNNKQYIVIEHKLEGEKRTSYSFLSGEREDGWLTAELYQFISEQRTVGLEIMFYTKYCPNLLVEGIEFRPPKMQPISVKETYWKQKMPKDYEDIIKWSGNGVQWETAKDLYCIFCRGFLIDRGEKWFYLDKDGKKCLMLPARAALQEKLWNWKPLAGTRFEVADDCNLTKFLVIYKFESALLSPETTYETYLVYRLPEAYKYIKPPPVQVVDQDSEEGHAIFLQTPKLSPFNRPKTKGLPKLRSDGWMEVQVLEFQTNTTNEYISTCLKLSGGDMGLIGITVQCLEFRPVSDTETCWEQKLPIDYEEIIKCSVNRLQWITKKELYYILCEGFLINSGEEWFSLAKDGKKCLMLPAKAVLEENEWEWNADSETRFGQLADCISNEFSIFCKFKSEMLSPQTTYATYLVYRLPHDYEDNRPVQVVDINSGSEEAYEIIGRNCKIERTYNPSIRRMIKSFPKQRSDKWMEAQVHKFQTPTTKTISTHLRFSSTGMSLAGITVQGLEFRPISEKN